jgi:ABC-type transporter MlaC component
MVDGKTVVNSEIIRTDGRRVQLDWFLTDNDGQYRITDVDVGGVSIKVGLRDQFTSWIQNNGGQFHALLVVLRQQIAQAP